MNKCEKCKGELWTMHKLTGEKTAVFCPVCLMTFKLPKPGPILSPEQPAKKVKIKPEPDLFGGEYV